MKLWLLKRTDRIGYDECDGFVVRAKTETDARALAAEQAGDEGKDVWLSPAVTCTELTAKGEPGIVLSSFNAG